MNLTNAQNALLWEHLDGVTEFEHDARNGSLSQSNNYQCYKCDREFWVKPSKSNTCPIPDEYKGTDADIAWEIQEWMRMRGKDVRFRYFEFIHNAWLEHTVKDFSDEAFSEWLLHEITPTDKINAFIEVVKSLILP